MTFSESGKEEWPVPRSPAPSVDSAEMTHGVWRRRLDWRSRQGGEAGITLILTFTQWLSWGSTYYLMTVLARPIMQDMAWSLTFVVSGLSLGLVVAGLVSPAVGRAIERRGGRPVLALGSLVLAGGLLGLGLARGPVGYLSAWAVLGIGMAASLYDAAFAALGRLYGLRARAIISNLMLIAAFSAALSWPTTALLLATFGWRGTCFCYAALHLAVALPVHFQLLPRMPTLPSAGTQPTLVAERPAPLSADAGKAEGRRALLVWLLGANVTLHIAIGSVLAVHLLSLLQGLGVAYGAAVGLGSVIWLSQGGGRLIEALIGRRVHPVSEGVVASLFVLIGLVLLLAAQPVVVAIGLVFFGIGNGVRGIVKGTLPLVLFGAEGYATLVGRLGLPTLIAQAAGPALGAVAVARWGATPSVVVLVILAAVNLLLSHALRIAAGRPRAPR